MKRYLIVGNGAAGVTAAETIRRADPNGQVSIVNAEGVPMYSRPGLAYVIIDEVSERQVIARKPEWYAQHRLNLLNARAERLDVETRTVFLNDGRRVNYDSLLIATGAKAIPPPYPGGDLEGSLYLDSLAGTRDLLRRAEPGRRAVVIGGGITALEMCEGLAHHGVETHYLLRKGTLWSAVFNAAESQLLEERMRAHGVIVHFNAEITSILDEGTGRVGGVILNSGERLDCELVGVAIGVRPQLELVKGTSIKVERGILVNEYLETSVPGVYAAGDCAAIYDRWTGQHLLDCLWPSAIAAGRAAGANMAGARRPYLKGVPFNAALLFGLHISAIGQLRAGASASLRGGAGGEQGSGEEEVTSLSRGSSQVWFTQPAHYASAWSQSGPNTLRLVLREDTLVGALVVGEQTLADPLRDMIERQVSVRALRPFLQEGGAALRGRLEELVKQLRS